MSAYLIASGLNNDELSDALEVMLPEKGRQPDYQAMETLISAVQKLLIRDVVLYADSKIDAAKEAVCGSGGDN